MTGDGNRRRRGGGPAPDPVPGYHRRLAAWPPGRNRSRRLCQPAIPDASLTAEQISFPPDVAALPGFLDEHYRNWRAGLAGLSPGQLAAPLGPSWGPYAEANTIDLALHVLDEVIHHGAEVGLLRDLYSHRSSLRS